MRESERVIYKTDGDTLYFINAIRNFLGKEPIVDYMAKKNCTYKNIFQTKRKMRAKNKAV